MLKTISITISGIVQGVFFRQSTKELATVLGLTGEVKNLPDETVHIVATGTSEQIERLITWCKQGPPKARVENVATKEVPLKRFDTFRIAR